MGDLPLPVDVGHVPGPAAQKQHAVAFLLAQERQFVHEPQLLPSVEHCEERRGQEHGEQFQEVPPPVGLLALLPDPQDALLLP